MFFKRYYGTSNPSVFARQFAEFRELWGSVGVALYGVAMVSKLPIDKVFTATLPFFIMLLAVMLFIPQIITWLPTQLM